MAQFSYEAAKKSGEIERGVHDAPDEAAVVDYLTRKRMIPVSIVPVARKKSAIAFPFRFETVSALDKMLFVRNLSVSIKAGLGLAEALEILTHDAKKRALRDIFMRMKAGVESGQPLSAALAAHPREFPDVYVGLVRAGESSGRLAETLDELFAYLLRDYNLRRRVKGAFAYPSVLLAASLGVVVFLVAFVMPRLTTTFAKSGTALPALTRALVFASDTVAKNYWFDGGIVALAAAAAYWFAGTKKGRAQFERGMMAMPFVSDLMKKVALVRFTRTLSGIIHGGSSIVDGLRFSAQASGNRAYAAALQACAERVADGVPLARALENHPALFPRFLTGLVFVGEKTGTLEEILKSFSNFFDDDVDSSLKELTSVIEPALLLFMGLLIGTIAFAILLPIYQIVGRF